MSTGTKPLTPLPTLYKKKARNRFTFFAQGIDLIVVYFLQSESLGLR